MGGSARRFARLAVVTGTFVVPWVVEAGVEARLAGGWARCGTGICVDTTQLRVDARGVTLGPTTVTRGEMRATLARAEVDVDGGSLHVVAHGVAVELARGAAAPAISTSTAPREGAPQASTTASLRWPVRLEVADPVRLAGPATEAMLRAVTLERDGDGRIRGYAVVAASVAGVELTSIGPLELGSEAGRTRLEGRISDDSGVIWQVALQREGEAVTAAARGDDGSARVSAASLNGPFVAALERFPLAPLARALPSGATREVDLTRARLSGTVRAERRAGGWSLELDNVTLNDLVVRDARVAPKPVELEPLEVSGRFLQTSEGVDAELLAGRHGVEARVAAALRRNAVELDLEIPETSCQDLVDELPTEAFAAIRGLRVRGRVGARLELAFDPAALAARAEDTDDEAYTPPGTARLELPFLERCEVESEPPLVDIAGVRGSYRHRFVGDDGRTQERVLTTGAPGFAALATVPLLARAFVTMEDTRFWRHDGFDREQIERAFWHNLGVGRISRGASTISQQTARNLWLGGDRSLARKLQEALLAARLEARVGKPRILEVYLNIIELGPEVHGVEEAARYHFGKAAAELGVLEALYIASLAPAPRTLSLRHHREGIPPAWVERLRGHAVRMYQHGYITHAQLLETRREPLALAPHA